jgi:micrococcal nuclease
MGKCVAVHDGDTFSVLNGTQIEKIRLKGVDCPELDQPYGLAATRYTSRKVLGKNVMVEVVKDHYERKVARVSVKGKDLGDALVGVGLAWQARKYDRRPDLAALQQQARGAHRGLWKADHPEAPWTHRHRQRKATATVGQAAEGLATPSAK